MVGRLWAPIRRRLSPWHLPTPPSRLQVRWRPSAQFLEHEPWNTRGEVLKGHFCFLNEEASLGRPVDWGAPEQSLLWRFHLHHCRYLHLLNDEEQVAVCQEWMNANPVGSGVGWHPYPTSRRLTNWCKAELTAPGVLESLYQQAAYLYRNVETQVYGNHLLENARALVLAGCYFQEQGEAEQWLEKGLSIYRSESNEQVLGDGFHFERSPMYHALMLEAYLDVLNVLPHSNAQRSGLQEAAKNMSDALAGVTRPGGDIALFNDSAHEIAPSSDRLLQYAQAVLNYGATPRTSLPEAGYFVFRGEDVWAMIDGGPAGPEYLMAHAHADMFSYELSLFGNPFVVDSGVFEYERGAMRRYVRSTEAHNTVQIDGIDQIECWHSFRVARREAPRDVEWTNREDGAIFEGQFAGYRSLIGDDIVHHRRVEIDQRSRRFQVRDTVTGEGEHCVESRIHLHPDVQARRDGSRFVLKHGENKCEITVTAGSVRLEVGWHCPRFGVRHRTCTLVIGGRVVLPSQLSYQLQY